MVVNEIFWSVQGEGVRTGVPSIFLRLGGCTLQCPYCDSRQAWTRGKKMDLRQIMAEIHGWARKYPGSQVVVTGGEPLEQDLSGLVEKLRKKNFFISIETNGIYFQDLRLDWWTVSPKDVGDFFVSGALHDKICEVKLIVNDNLTVGVIEKIRSIRDDFPIFLQPDHSDRNRYRNTHGLFVSCQEKGIKNIRLGLQMHRIFDIK